LALVSATAHAQSPNRPPEAVGTLANLSLRPDEGPRTLNLSGAFSDPDGDALSLSASSSDEPVATVEAMALTVIVTPVAGGTTTVTVTATDPGGMTATQEFEVTVANRPPEALSTLPMLQLQVDEPHSVDVSGVFTDPDDDFLTITAASSNTAVATVEVRTSAVLVTPVLHGTTTVTVTATDPGGLSATQTFEVTVANRPPDAHGLSTIPALRVEDGPQTVDVSGAFTDPDNDVLTITVASSNTAVARASAAGAVVTVTPLSGGVTTLTLTATDPGGLSVSQSLDVAVANRPPAAVGRRPHHHRCLVEHCGGEGIGSRRRHHRDAGVGGLRDIDLDRDRPRRFVGIGVVRGHRGEPSSRGCRDVGGAFAQREGRRPDGVFVARVPRSGQRRSDL
jgi:hypothetical protein